MMECFDLTLGGKDYIYRYKYIYINREVNLEHDSNILNHVHGNYPSICRGWFHAFSLYWTAQAFESIEITKIIIIIIIIIMIMMMMIIIIIIITTTIRITTMIKVKPVCETDYRNHWKLLWSLCLEDPISDNFTLKRDALNGGWKGFPDSFQTPIYVIE